MDKINAFVRSMQVGPEKFTLTDEGDIDKFLGIEKRILTISDSKFPSRS